MPEISILIPHKHALHNDDALAICLDCIIRNTRCDYELLVDTTTPADPYAIYNSMAAKAAGKWIVPMNSDTFVAPDWDVALLENAQHHRIVTPILVECGAIPVNDRNVERAFGMKPSTFRRAEFEDWTRSTDIQPRGEGWYMPALFHRMMFLQIGGYDTSQGAFPTPLDGILHDKWHALGMEIRQVRSFCYHLQAFSDGERVKENRAAERRL